MSVTVLSRGRSLTYRPTSCPNCGRDRVELSGICEKCGWDVDGDDYAVVTRPASRCVVCRSEADPDGSCPDEHWHGLGEATG